MTALTNAEIPVGFTTLDQLIAYCGVAYASVQPKLTYMVSETAREKVADRAIVRTYDGRDFLVIRAAIPLNSDYLTGSNPIWTYAEENAVVPLPAGFTA